MSFPETISTGQKILDSFQDTRWIILASPMQAGKTSVYTYVANQMKEQGIIDNVFVISGISDNALREQTYDRIRHLGKVYFLYDISQKAKGNVIAALKEFSNSLIVIDESHIGANNGSELHDFLNLLGIGANGDIDLSLYPGDRQPYILSVSATPYAECATISQENGSTKIIVRHVPGESYFGLDKMKLINIENIFEPDPQLRDALVEASQRMPKSYAIVRSLKKVSFRSPDGQLIQIPYDNNAGRDLIETLDYPIIYCDMDNDTDIVSHLEQEPEEFTIILIKKYARAGQTFPKKYISMVWEIFSTTDEQAQGLPGRICGYEDASQVNVYCSLQSLQEHINWMSNDYLKQYIPRSGKNIRSSSSGNAIREYQKIGIFSSKEEALEASPDFGYVTGPDFKVHVGNREWSDEEMRDERGFIRQYLPIGKQGEVQAWSLDFMQDFLLNQRPLLNAITQENGNKVVSVAKIAYRDLEDPSSQVYVLYSYNGPVSTSSVEATDNSMYMHSTSEIQLQNTIVQHVQLPLGIREEDALEIVLPLLYKPLSIVVTPEGRDASRIIEKVTQQTIETLEWRGSLSREFLFLSPYFEQRKELNIPFYTPSSQKETTEFIISIFAPSEEKALTGKQLDSNPIIKYLWKYKRPISDYLAASSNSLNINKKKLGGANFYYS